MSDHNVSGLKPAPFWLDDPALWFAQTEAQFWYFNVKDDLAKFNYTIAQLNKDCLTIAKEVVLSPPPTNKYDALKSTLLSKFKESEVKKIKEILMAEDIGNRKPSEFLHHLKRLAGQDVEEDFIKGIWSSHLPTRVQWVMTFLPSSSLEKIAQLADLAINSPSMKPPMRKCHPGKLTDAQSETMNPDEDVVKDLTKRVEELTVKVDEISAKSNKDEKEIASNFIVCNKSTTKTASTLSLVSHMPTNEPKKYFQNPLIICWYHTQFGWSATKCVQPCNFTVCSFGFR